MLQRSVRLAASSWRRCRRSSMSAMVSDSSWTPLDDSSESSPAALLSQSSEIRYRRRKLSQPPSWSSWATAPCRGDRMIPAEYHGFCDPVLKLDCS